MKPEEIALQLTKELINHMNTLISNGNTGKLILNEHTILEIYTTHRIDSELRREATNNKNL